MKLKFSWILAPIVLVAFLQLQLVATAVAQEGRHRTLNDGQITIRIHNYTQIKSAVLLRAEQSADYILREAGIESNWVECRVGETPTGDAACARPMTSLDVIVNLVPRSMAKRSNFRDEVFGVAIEGTERDFGFFASVFYENVKDCAVHERIDLAPFLGGVMAHELGHLLLGTHSHSRSGLMSDFWLGKQILEIQQRRLSFSTSEAKRLQTAVRVRGQAVKSITEHTKVLTFLEGQRSLR